MKVRKIMVNYALRVYLCYTVINMKIILKSALFLLLVSFVYTQQKVQLVTFSQLQNEAQNKKNDTLYVVSFWATWCKPCVQEMPFFEEASKQHANEKLKIIYVSLNSPKELASTEKFIEIKNIQNKVLLLNETNPNNWIDKVDASWSGSIPATVMYKKGKKVFFKESSFTQEEINSIINEKNK